MAHRVHARRIMQRNSIRVLLFAASLRRESLNGRLVEVVADIIRRRGDEADVAAMSDFDCPSYDGDEETANGIAAGAERLRDRLALCDAFIIASPEYNGSMPGVVKNALDWA
jgi:NAD(P)H-dependent FMN reductase